MRELVIDVTRLVDRRLHGRQPTGVDRVCLAYVRHFRARAVALIRFAGLWIYFSPAGSQRLFSQLLSAGVDGGVVLRMMVAWSMLKLAFMRRPHGAWLLNPGHSGLDKADYPAQIDALGLRPLFVVHDLIPLTHPQYCRAGEATRHRRRMDTVVRHAQGVIVNSHGTLHRLQEYARETSQRLPPVVVAPLALTPWPDAASVPLIRGTYFLILGTLEPRKNHALILQVWRELALRDGLKAPSLVIVGQVGWDCEAVLATINHCEAIKPHIVHEASCSDARLATWLRHACAVLFPSFAEGYGLPLVEALSSGIPAIASDLPVFREIAGEIPEYLDPSDAVTWADMVQAYARPHSHLRASQLGRLARFSAPTWSRHFSLIETLLEQTDAAAA